MPICILMEKKNAFSHMVDALHGKKVNYMEGKAHFHGKDYLITHAQGHLLQYKAPSQMVKDKAKAKVYDSWKFNAPIWNPKDLTWEYKPISSYDRKMIKQIAYVANQCSSFIIAGDNDPDGEGDKLQVEILGAIHWNKPVYRIRFQDDGVLPDLRKQIAYHVTPMNNKTNQGIYHEAVGRAHWDYFVGLQDTRKATSAARTNGYHIKVANEGRLKSTIVAQIRKRLLARKNYIKKPYWEVQFKDQNGHVYSRRASYNSHPDFRFTDQNKAKADLSKYHNSEPANVKTQTKTQAPGQLLNLASLGALLNRRGYSPKEVQTTYQQMYENQYVSYPRTDDKKITLGQFDQLLPLVNKIATVVGVDTKLLTHRKPRKKFLTKHADHGANRPGLRVPSSLSSLKKYGASGPAIYSTLSKNYLAMLGEDYVYKRTTAHLADYPKFKTSYTQPVKMNYKLIFDNYPKKPEQVEPLGKVDKPFLHSGTNPKPSAPTTGWLYRLLEKYNIGTGATRQGTVAILTSGKNKKINIKRGKLNLTNSGIICAEMAQGTMIGSLKITAQLYQLMRAVKTGKVSIPDVEKSAVMVVKHDKDVFAQNAKHLSAKKGKGRETFPVNVNGQIKNVNRNFAGHRFTDQEVQQLKAHQHIEIGPFKVKGIEFKLKGHLAPTEFKKGSKVIHYYGFVEDQNGFIRLNAPERFNFKLPNGQMAKPAPKRVWNHHRFTDQEINTMQQYKNITIACPKKSGQGINHFKGTIKAQTFKSGSKTYYYYGFSGQYVASQAQQKRFKAWQAEIAKWPMATINGKKGKFRPSIDGHDCTDTELTQLESGATIKLDGLKKRKGGTFTAPVKLKWVTYRGKKELQLRMIFK